MRQHHQTTMGQGDNTAVYLIVGIVLIGLLSWMIQQYTVVFYHGWKVVFFPLAVMIDKVAHSVLGDMINPLLGTTKIQAHALVTFLSNTPPNAWSTSGFMAMNHFMGKYVLILLLPMGIYAAVCVFKNTQAVGNAFRYFKDSQSLNKYIIPSETRKIIARVPNDCFGEEPLGPAMSCLVFCKHHRLIAMDESTDTVTDFDQSAAFDVLNQQLGPVFESRSALLNSELGWLVTELMQMIPSQHREEVIDSMLDNHIYLSTIILRLLESARRFGVVPVSSLLRLKVEHRALWYALVSLGRKVAFVEGAGIIAQFHYERGDQLTQDDDMKKLPAQIEPAVQGLMKALLEEPLGNTINRGVLFSKRTLQ